MFPKRALKNSPTLVLAACVIFTSCNCAVAQTSATIGHIRSLPTIETQTHQETGQTASLFTIKEKKPLPRALPSSKTQFSKARIVSVKNLVPPEAQSQTNVAPPAPAVVAAPEIRVAQRQAIVPDNAAPTNIESSTSHYTISFAQPYKGPQSDEDAAEVDLQKELDSAKMDDLETDELIDSDADDDLDVDEDDMETTEDDMDTKDEDSSDASDDDLDLSDDEDDLDMSDDDESADELDYDEDDTPIARPEIGPWPRKSIQEVRLNLAENGAQSPEDRSSKLYESSRRIDGSIAATEKVFAWAAPNINYQPLYFEDVALERYGQTKGLVQQPFVSAGKFLADKLLLGTRAMRVHPKSCDSPLGFCRPGSPSTAADCGCDTCR